MRYRKGKKLMRAIPYCAARANVNDNWVGSLLALQVEGGQAAGAHVEDGTTYVVLS